MAFSMADLGRLGDNMRTAMRLTHTNGPYESLTALGREVAPDAASSTGTDAVYRCIERGLLEQDADHPNTAVRSSGAVVLTADGKSLVSLLGFPDPDEAEPEPESEGESGPYDRLRHAGARAEAD